MVSYMYMYSIMYQLLKLLFKSFIVAEWQQFFYKCTFYNLSYSVPFWYALASYQEPFPFAYDKTKQT